MSRSLKETLLSLVGMDVIPTRLAILVLVKSEGEISGTQLRDIFDSNSVYHHLQRLKISLLLKTREDEKGSVYCSVTEEGLRVLSELSSCLELT